MVKQKLDIPITVKDQGSQKTLRDLNKGFVRFRGNVNKVLKPVKAFGTGLGNLRNRIFSIQGAFVGLSTFLVGRGIKSIIDQSDAIGKLARSTGDAVEDLSALDFAMQASGFRAEDLRVIMTGVGRSISSALGGNKLQVDAFTELGIGIDSLRDKGAVEVLGDMAEGLERIGLADQKRILRNIFPDNFQKVLPLIGQGADAYERLLELARQSGAVINDEDVRAAEEFNDALLSAQSAAGGLFRAFATEFAGDAAQILKGVTAVIRQEDETLRSLFKDLAGFASLSIEGLLEVIKLGAQGVELFTSTARTPFTRKLRREADEFQRQIDEENRRRPPGALPSPELERLIALRNGTLKAVENLERDVPQLSERLAGIQNEIAINIAKFGQGQDTDKLFDAGDTFRELDRVRAEAERAAESSLRSGPDDEATQRTVLALSRDRIRSRQQILALGEGTLLQQREEIALGRELFEVEQRLKALDDPAARAGLDNAIAASRENERRQIEELTTAYRDQQIQIRAQFLDATVSALQLLEPTEEITREIQTLSAEADSLTLEAQFRAAGVEAELIEKVLAKIRTDASKATGTNTGFTGGVERGLESIQRRFGTLSGVGEEVGGVLTGAFSGVSDVLVRIGDDTQDTGEAFKQLAGSIVRDLARIAIQSSLTGLLGANGLNILGSAQGNVFSNGRVVPFAQGGIINRPTVFPLRGATGLAGEAGPEAIVPLQRMPNGDLGVRADMGSQQNGGSPTLIIQLMTPDPQSGLAYIESQREPIRGMFHDFLSEGGPTRTLVMNGGRRV